MSDPGSHARSDSPSHVRYWIVGLATLMAVLLYLHRYCMSFTERFIREELRLSNTEISFLVSAFFIAYGIGQVPSGWLSDRYGARRMLTLYILVWSIMTGVMGLAGSFLMVMIFRLGLGLGQAGAYPTGALMVSKWMPPSQRGLASGIISMGGRLGAVLAPILTGYLLLAYRPAEPRITTDDILDSTQICRDLVLPHEKKPHVDELSQKIRSRLSAQVNEILETGAKGDSPPPFPAKLRLVVDELNDHNWYDLVDAERFDVHPNRNTAERNRELLENAFPKSIRKLQGLGWRPTFYVYGVVGIVFALVFWLVVRDAPALHPLCNTEEADLIGASSVSVGSSSGVGALPLGHLLKSRSLWFSSIQQFFTNFAWLFIPTTFQRYLLEVHHVPLEERGWMTSVPIALGILGMVAGGWLTDSLTNRVGKFWGRCLPMSLTRFLAMLGYLACMFFDSPWQVTLALGVVAIATDLGTPAVWAFCQDIGGKHVGSALGWGNMWGNFGAVLSLNVLNLVIEGFGWNMTFLACAIAFFLSGLAGFGIDARIPLVPAKTELPE